MDETTYSWSHVEEVNCSSSVSHVSLWINGNVDIAPPDSLQAK